jgi:hypothetical protein
MNSKFNYLLDNCLNSFAASTNFSSVALLKSGTDVLVLMIDFDSSQ